MKTSSGFALRSMRMSGLALASLVTGVGSLKAANVNLTASGAYFASGAGWSNAAAPGAGNAYFTNNYNLLTDVSSASFTFGGGSLTVGSGTGIFVTRTTGTVTIADLRLNGGGVQNWGAYAPAVATLAGKITLTNFGYIRPSEGRNIRVSSVIGGSGGLRVKAGKALLNAANTYTGGTLVETDATYGSGVVVEKDFALGTGDVVLQSGTTLKLGGGTVHDYIGDGATLVVPTGIASGSVDLSFPGTDRIDALSLNGGASLAAEGLWGAPGNTAADYTDPVFTGTGLLQVGAPATLVNSLGERFVRVWSDPFNSFNSTRWKMSGTTGAAAVSNGTLALTTYESAPPPEQKFQGERLATNDKLRYGRYEAVILTDIQPGVCNAFYTQAGTTMGGDTKENWNEIDIMEILGDRTPMQNLIWEIDGASRYSNHITPVLADGLHVFTVDWTPNNISFYVDGRLMFTKPTDSYGNGVSRMLLPQEIHLSNWMAQPELFNSANPLSVMLVDKVTYYYLAMTTRTSANVASATSSGYTITGDKVTGLSESSVLSYNTAIDTHSYRNITIELSSDNVSNRDYLKVLSPQPVQWKIQVRNGSASGTILAEIPIPYTHGEGTIATDYDSFRQVSANLPDVGNVNLYLTFTDGVAGTGTNPCIIRDIHFHGTQPRSNSRNTIIHAKNVAESSGAALVFSKDDYVGTLNSGYVLRYRDIDFTSLNKVVLEISNGNAAGAGIELFVGDRSAALNTSALTKIHTGTVTAPITQGWRDYQLLEVPITASVSGKKDLWIKFTGGSGTAGNLRSIRFPR